MDIEHNESGLLEQDPESSELYSGKLYDINRMLFKEALNNNVNLGDIESFDNEIESAAGNSDGVVYINDGLKSEILEDEEEISAYLKDKEEEEELYTVKAYHMSHLEDTASENSLDVLNEKLDESEAELAFYTPGKEFSELINPREVSLTGWSGLITPPEYDGIDLAERR